MRNFYYTCKFCTLTINFSEIWPRQILLKITILEIVEDVLKKFSESLEDVLKMSWRRLEDVLKMPWRSFCKTSWRRLENVLKTSWRRMIKANILTLIKASWRCLEDVFWRRMSKANIFVLIKTSWRRLHQDECLLGSYWKKQQSIFTVYLMNHVFQTSIQ